MIDSLQREDLIAQREFLLRSITDLDAEAAAGDLAPDDHAALRDDYVARAAAVLRALDGVQPEVVVTTGRRLRRTPVVIASCIALATLAGVALARSSGSRAPGAPLSGSLPAGTADDLARAAQLFGAGKAVDAVKLYDRILARDPAQPTALAYKGWLIRLAGLTDQGLAAEDRAVASDPTYPDAHFFRGMMLWQDGHDPAGAVAEFRLFLANRPPRQMVGLVEDALKRAAAEAGIAPDG